MQIDDTCKVCKQKNDDILMLTCVHNPCIDCAASNYAELVHIKNKNPNVYSCELCGEETQLDADTVTELSHLAKSFIKIPSPNKPSQTKGVGKVGSFDRNTININNNAIEKRQNYFCKFHGEEELTYFCFVCKQNICSECAIHGSHKDHQVKLIKKAIIQVKQQFLDIVSKMAMTQNSMGKFRDGFERSIKQASQRNIREKQLVAQEFQLLRNQITNKQREIVRDLDSIYKQNVITLQNFITEITKLYEDLQSSKKQIQGILLKSDVIIFEQYKNVPKLEQKTEQSRQKSEQIKGQNQLFDSVALKQQTKRLQQIIKDLKSEYKKEGVSGAPNTKNIKKENGIS